MLALFAPAGCHSGPGAPSAAANPPFAPAAIDWQAMAQAQGQYPHQAPFLEPFAS
ncbi:MAG: hypothetical protein Q4A98_00910 [Comamonadaceae bacterium]|nr:hypothetical protein [Comamonadaceae bacterium]